MTAFWDVILCSFIELDQHFRGSLLIALKMDRVRTSTSQRVYSALSQMAVIFILAAVRTWFLNCHQFPGFLADSIQRWYSSSSLWLYGPCRAFASLTMPAHSGRRILGSGRLFSLGFSTIVVLRDGVVSPCPTPNLEGQASVFITPGDRVAQLYPQAPGTHFSRLLRHAWVAVGLFLFPATTREIPNIPMPIK
jgi:hypothetical protein